MAFSQQEQCRGVDGLLCTAVGATRDGDGGRSKSDVEGDAVSGESDGPASPFSMVIDGGSTGSRLHIFEFVQVDSVNADEAKRIECVRRGTARSNGPMSGYARPSLTTSASQPLNASDVAEHVLPLFEYAATIVPEQYHLTTPAKVQATAGMRLVKEEEAEAVYDAMYKGLMDSPRFVFRAMKRSDITTLSGEMEGIFGAVAANYLNGMIDVHLNMVKPEEHSDEHHHPLGALDMGGSSTQLVFLPRKEQQAESAQTSEPVDAQTCEPGTESAESANTQTSDRRLSGSEFFSTSYLAFGVDQFRERLWDVLVRARRKKLDETVPVRGVVENPCGFRGLEQEWKGHILRGTGDAAACADLVRAMIPHGHDFEYEHNWEVVADAETSRGDKEAETEIDPSQQCSETTEPPIGGIVGGRAHPPIKGKFFAMSLYFFTLDSLRALSHPDPEAHEALNSGWPNPTLIELENALDGLCGRDWHEDLALIQHSAHEFTRAEVLPHRCVESVYLVTLLRHGFGFDPSSRDITFTFLVNGSEVEWSLGMALTLFAESRDLELLNGHDMEMVKELERQNEQIFETSEARAMSNSYQLWLMMYMLLGFVSFVWRWFQEKKKKPRTCGRITVGASPPEALARVSCNGGGTTHGPASSEALARKSCSEGHEK